MEIIEVYERRREEYDNDIKLTINGKTYNVTDWIADLAFAGDDIKENVHYKDPTLQALLNNACDQLYNIVNDNWHDEYTN